MMKLDIDIMIMGGGKILSFPAISLQPSILSQDEKLGGLGGKEMPSIEIRKKHSIVYRLS
jgi:hypothetical protein